MEKTIITRAMCFKQPSGSILELTEGLELDSYFIKRIVDNHLIQLFGKLDKKSATKNFDLWVKFEKKIGSKQL